MKLKAICTVVLGVIAMGIAGCAMHDREGAGADPMRPIGSGGRGTGPVSSSRMP